MLMLSSLLAKPPNKSATLKHIFHSFQLNTNRKRLFGSSVQFHMWRGGGHKNKTENISIWKLRKEIVQAEKLP